LVCNFGKGRVRMEDFPYLLQEKEEEEAEEE
jgi:hypothetical protein